MQDDFQDQRDDRRESKKCFISLDERVILKTTLPFHNADPGGEIELGVVARTKKSHTVSSHLKNLLGCRIYNVKMQHHFQDQ